MSGQGYRFNPLLKYGFQREQTVEDGGSGELATKVDKFQGGEKTGMVLYVNQDGLVDMRNIREITAAERTKLANMPSYGIDVVATTDGYLKTYQLYASVNGKKTYVLEKINIPKDLHIRSVDVVEVSDEHPMQGYINGKYLKYVFVTESGDKVQMINVKDIFDFTLEAGDHISVEKYKVTAHSFVPQYDSVDKVLPDETVFHYTGESDDRFVHGYVYEKQLTSQPVTDISTYQIAANTKYIDILVDGYLKPRGRYYMIPNYKYVASLKAQYNNQIKFYIADRTSKNIASDGKYYQCVGPDVLKVGDYVWNMDNVNDRHKIVSINAYNQITLDNNAKLTYSTRGGSEGYLDAYVNEHGDMIFLSNITGILALELREYDDWNGKNLMAYNDGVFVENQQWESGRTPSSLSLTVNYSYGEEAYDWVQLDVQPREEPFDPMSLAKVARTGSYDDLIDKPISEGSTTYWNTNKSYIPKKGEIIIYTDYEQDDNKKNIPNFKVGDGKAYVIDLPFAGCDYLIKKHISDKTIHHEIGLSTTENECLIIT